MMRDMGAPPTPAPLVSARELASRIGDPLLLVVDCRFDLARPDWGRSEYRAGHLPGAVYAHLDTDLSGVITPETGRHPLPAPAAFAATLGRWGFTPASSVVCYDQGNGAHAARLWWMLRARGHTAVQVLDGGIAAWRGQQLPEETALPQRERTLVDTRVFAGALGTPDVARGLADGSIRLVDARAADRFAGRNETIDPVAGHVPGALNHPFAMNLGPDGLFLDAATLRERWREVVADSAPGELVMMCGSGVTACHNLLALALQGIEGARLYAGSYSEWIRDPARPVATGLQGVA